MGDFRCGKGFLALCGAGCPHLFSKPDRVTAHKVIGFCLLKDLVEHPSCLADVRIRAAIAPHPFQKVFNVDGAYDGQGAMVKSLFEHFQAVFVAFLCRGSDIILVTLEPCIGPILKVQDRVQLDTADKRILILFQFELDLLLSLAMRSFARTLPDRYSSAIRQPASGSVGSAPGSLKITPDSSLVMRS